MGVFCRGLQAHEIHHIDHADLELRQVLPQNFHRSQRLDGGLCTAAGHDHIRLLALVVGGPLPDTQALGAVLDGLLHGEVLHSRVLGGHDHIDIVAAADTVVNAAEQAVGIGRQVQPHHIGGLVGNMVQKAGVLMGKAIVVLGPDGGSQNDVEGGDVLAPGDIPAELEPFGVLGNHGVHDADKGLIAVEESMAAGEQIALQPAFAHVLGELAVHDAAVDGEEFVAVYHFTVEIAVGGLKDAAELVGHGLIRSEEAEVAGRLIEPEDVADKATQLQHVLRLYLTGLGDLDRVLTEVGQAQIAQQPTAVGVGIGAHATGPFGRELLELRH